MHAGERLEQVRTCNRGLGKSIIILLRCNYFFFEKKEERERERERFLIRNLTIDFLEMNIQVNINYQEVAQESFILGGYDSKGSRNFLDL